MGVGESQLESKVFPESKAAKPMMGLLQKA
jgi:uncharacterized protein (DUF1501 family)